MLSLDRTLDVVLGVSCLYPGVLSGVIDPDKYVLAVVMSGNRIGTPAINVYDFSWFGKITGC
jgi:hypothetical protein